jgi:hypothetical protein
LPNEDRQPTDDELADLERANSLTEGLEPAQDSGPFGDVPWWQVAIGVALLLIAALALWAANRYNRGIEGDVGRSYLRLGEWARWLGIPWRTTQTPYEQADALVTVVPQGQQPIRNLTRQYVLQLFSPARATEDGFDAHTEWRQLRPVLLRQSVVNFLNRARGSKE